MRAVLFFSVSLVVAGCVAGLARWNVFNPNAPASDGPGSLNAAFGVNGTLVTKIGEGISEINSIYVYPDGENAGKILAAGYAFSGGRGAIALARFTAAGELDTSFAAGQGYILTVATDAINRGHHVAVGSNGGISVVGTGNNATSLVVCRYDATGSLLNGFPFIRNVMLKEGEFFGGFIDSVRDDVFAGGYVVGGSTFLDPNLAVAAVKSVPALDTDVFASAGEFADSSGPLSKIYWMDDVDADVFLSAGWSQDQKHLQIVKWRKVNATAEFAFDQALSTDPLIPFQGAYLSSLDMVVGGTLYSSVPKFLWTRHRRIDLSQVLLSTTEGYAAESLGDDGEGRGIAVYQDRVLMGGWAKTGGRDYFAAARFLNVGVLDSAFNETGKMLISLGTNDRAHALAISPAGNLLLGGYATVDGEKRFALASVVLQ